MARKKTGEQVETETMEPAEEFEEVYEPLDLSKKVTIISIAPWITSFRGVAEVKDFQIPPNGQTLITRNEILNQIDLGNKLFVGTDGNGSHATLYIDDAATRRECNFESANSKQQVLTEQAIKDLFAIKSDKKFAEEIKNVIVTRAEKFAALDLLDKLQINDYRKIRIFEDYVGAEKPWSF